MAYGVGRRLDHQNAGNAQSCDRVVGDALTIVCVNDQQPRSVYIDINHWYELARADDGKPDKPEHAAILRKLLAEVDAGRLVVPLSSVTYTELTENPRDHLRQPAAGGDAQALAVGHDRASTEDRR